MLRSSLLAAFVLVLLPACGKNTNAAKNASDEISGSAPGSPEEVPRTRADTPETSAEQDPVELPLLDFPHARRAHGYLVGGALTPEHVVEARDKGYERIIDLRGEDEEGVAEERAKARELGIPYISFPIDGADGLTEANAQSFAELLAQDPGPTIVHCRSGNRVGALFALRAHYIDKKPAEEALRIGLDAGLTKLEDQVREILERE